MLPMSTILRLAQRLRSVWADRTGDPPGLADDWRAFDDRVARVHAARRRIDLARKRHLTLIEPQLADEAAACLRTVVRQVEHLVANNFRPVVRVPELGDLVADFRQLEAEFGAVEVRWADAAVRVRIDAVVLEDIDLGPFAIDFVWNRLGRRNAASCFDVVALEPNPAAGRDDVVHPHVRDGLLCPGDAEDPLVLALAGGRLADGFLLVRNVLTTYNPHSPHVPLEEWAGFACAECGYRADDEDRFTCAACGADVCDSCASYCTACSSARCGQCMEACAACRAPCCPGCLHTGDAGKEVCPDCVPRCPKCSGPLPAAEHPGAASVCSHCHPEEDDHDENEALDSNVTAVVSDIDAR